MTVKSILRSVWQLLRPALLALQVVLVLGWTSPGQAKSSGLQLSTGSPAMVAEAMAENGILTKDVHETVLRFAPPLTITTEEIASNSIPGA